MNLVKLIVIVFILLISLPYLYVVGEWVGKIAIPLGMVIIVGLWIKGIAFRDINAEKDIEDML